jgi:quaternary ammonium compound-resistance protein SugE
VIQVGPFFLAPMDEEYVRDMKVIAFYAVAAALYVAGGTFMKYSQGLTRLLPSLALVMLFSAGALLQAWAMKHEALGPSYVVVLGLEALLAMVAGRVIFTEPVTVKIFCGVALVVLGIILLRMA